MKEELLDQEEQRPLACPNNTQKGKPSNAMLLKVSQGNYPHIVEKGGKNIDRFNLKFGVRILTKAGESVHRDYNFTISGDDAENRKAAAKDLLDGFPVRLECPDLTLDGVNNLKLSK
ncbi:hypothetical protein OUZ56_016714 [Daphnia magna]|uniref:K Homology domain-containing protein n=1 Tax=Daphnia magna TaxID=35525 RepID=A0ABR0ARC4_9CRUS|nr:hypothetical protein OUZ56_016714 [Daphnia magna]